jgi:hypothetical protein
MKRTREQRYAEKLITDALAFAYSLNQLGLDVQHVDACQGNRPAKDCAGCRRYAKIQALKLPAWERVQRRVRAAREYSTLWDGRSDRMLSYRKRFLVLQRDGFRCTACGVSAKFDAILHVDHIIPWTKGGTNDMDNLTTLCLPCNYGKYNDIVAERVPLSVTNVRASNAPAQPAPRRRRPSVDDRRAADLARLAEWNNAA